MKRWTTSLLFATAGLIAAFAAPLALADDDNDKRASVTVSFGAGLNTAQPGNAVNHEILPNNIRVRKGGVVNFVVGGFHQIMVYKPGRKPESIVVPAAGLFINDLTDLYYQGIGPQGTPPAGLSNAQNRVESVSFAEEGTYLVICNVRPHFLDGMYAFVRVKKDD